MTTMRAARQLAYGINPDTIVVQDNVPRPTLDPNSNSVLVRVHSASINPADFRIARGDVQMVMKRTFPHTIGFDVAGTVEKIGNKCQRLKVGDQVYGDCDDRGSMAEYVAVPEEYLSLKPSNISFEEAAAVPLAGLTAYQAIKNTLRVTEGQKVLVLGGSGGVGSLAIQFAKALGAKEVAATSSNVDLVKKLGADVAINYKEQEWFDVLKGHDYDALLDCVGDGWSMASQVLKPKGAKFCAVSVTPTHELSSVSLAFIASQIFNVVSRSITGALGYSPTFYPFMTKPSDVESLAAITALIESGKVRPVLDSSHPPYKLDAQDILAMFESIMSNRVKGKLVLSVL